MLHSNFNGKAERFLHPRCAADQQYRTSAYLVVGAVSIPATLLLIIVAIAVTGVAIGRCRKTARYPIAANSGANKCTMPGRAGA